MREYRSEFSPQHGVWILKRVACEAREAHDDTQAVGMIPTARPAQTLRLVESKSLART